VNNDVRLRGEVEEDSGFGKNKGNRGKRGVGLRVCCRAFSPFLCITWRGRRWAMDDYMREMGDLKTLVTKTLEKKGVLARIRVKLFARFCCILLICRIPMLWLHVHCDLSLDVRRSCKKNALTQLGVMASDVHCLLLLFVAFGDTQTGRNELRYFARTVHWHPST
jgi:hypothetical protein